MLVAWFSGGISSLVSIYLMKDLVDEILYIHIEDQGEDTLSFVRTCELLLGKKIKILYPDYKSVEDVVLQFRYLVGAGGAKCSQVLKVRTRKAWEANHRGKNITYIWGYDSTEVSRMEKMLEHEQRFEHCFPLAKYNMTQEDAHGFFDRLRLPDGTKPQRPVAYQLGFKHSNCLGCLKGGKYYFNMIRKYYPEVFFSRLRLEESIGHSILTQIVDGKKVPLFLKDLDPNDGRPNDEVMIECSLFCHMAYEESHQ